MKNKVGKSVMEKISSEFPVTVNYAETIEEMVGKNKFDRVNPNINQYNFPHNRRDGIQKITIKLIRLNLGRGENMVAEHVCFAINQLDKRGFRPANLPELLAIDKEYSKEYSKKFNVTPVVGFDPTHGSLDGNPYGIYFVTEKLHELRLMWGVFDKYEEYLIAVVLKKHGEPCILDLVEDERCSDLLDDD